jgi:hypothetical protein
VLRVYLAHFAGASAASFVAMTPSNADPLSAWRRLGEELGLTGANVGERRAASSGPEKWSGVVEHIRQDAQQRYVLLRLDAPSPGVALLGTDAKSGGGTSVSLARYFYGDDSAALAAESEPRWRDWLTTTFGKRKE